MIYKYFSLFASFHSLDSLSNSKSIHFFLLKIIIALLRYTSHSILLPRWHSGKESANAGKAREHRFSPWVWKIPWRRKQHSTPVFLPGESHGQRSLVGYSPWGHKEQDMTEWLNWPELKMRNVYKKAIPCSFCRSKYKTDIVGWTLNLGLLGWYLLSMSSW